MISRISNASGCWATTETQLDALVEAGLLSITTKTCTLYPCAGNPRPNIMEGGGGECGATPTYTINAIGLANPGYLYYRNLYPKYAAAGITYVISLDAGNIGDLLDMLADYNMYIKACPGHVVGVRELVECNVSCPNMGRSRIIAYDMEMMEVLLTEIARLGLDAIAVGYKIPPFTDYWQLGEFANMMRRFAKDITFLTCCNSVPGGYSANLGTRWGGISGEPAHLLAIGVVVKLGELLEGQIPIIGCGGIENTKTTNEFLDAGAIAVQVGRALMCGDFDGVFAKL